MDYLRAHWRGELSLGISYWINGCLLGFLLNLLGVGLEGLLAAQNLRVDWGLVALVTGQVVFLLLVSLWQVVGIWRSATNHVARSGRRFWATAAKAALILGGLSAAVATVDAGRVLLYTVQVASGQLDRPFEVEEVEGTDLHLTGDINYRSVDRVRALAKANAAITVLVINSPGGLIGAGMELGELVEEAKLTVIADGECLSACTLPLVASPASAMVPGTVIGFHSGGGIGVAEAEAAGNKLMDDFLIEHGVDAQVISRLNATPYEEMWMPSLQELVDYGVIEFVFDLERWTLVEAEDWCEEQAARC